ncbi:hypothetical protein J3325_09205 [Leuconostoc mesenteroides]|uniref:beta family protein n=1 Tax=Leuconostoc TaxID=1243 RepID=UPI001CBCDA78|nr:beta family protein [Leuconostoc mesenteroides]MBZ1527941.1 hypothetical protein [Leuconostoc mesenteroides]
MYLAALQPKSGELTALKELTQFPLTKEKFSNFLPLFLLTDGTKALLNKIVKKYPYHSLLSLSELEEEEVNSVTTLIKNEEFNNFKLAIALEDLNNGFSDQNIGAVIINVNSWSLYRQWLEDNLAKLPSLFILDFGEISNTNVPVDFNLLMNILKDKQKVILSGSVPKTIPMPQTQNWREDLIEYDLYTKILASYPEEDNISFGDYTTKNPEPLSNGFGSVAQIRYTRQLGNNKFDIWFVRNGIGNSANILQVATTLVSDPLFSDKSWADWRIREIIKTAPLKSGNSTTWVSINVNRHISLFI